MKKSIYIICICTIYTSQIFSLSPLLWFYHPYIFATKCLDLLYIIQTMNFVGSNNLSLKYQRFTLYQVAIILNSFWHILSLTFLLFLTHCKPYIHLSEGVKSGHNPQNQISNHFIFATWWCKPLVFKLSFFYLTEFIV